MCIRDRFSLVAGGALSSAMIPVLLSARQKDGEAAAWRLVGLVLTALLAFMAAVIVIVGLFTPFFVENLLAPGFDAATSRLTVTLTRIMLAQPLVLAVGSVATAVLNSRNRFLPTALSVVSHNVALIAGIIASGLIPGPVSYTHLLILCSRRGHRIRILCHSWTLFEQCLVCKWNGDGRYHGDQIETLMFCAGGIP